MGFKSDLIVDLFCYLAVATPDEEDTIETEQKDITESENLKPLKEEEPP